MSFRDTLIDDLNAISPAKGTVALALLALGMLAMWQAPTLWPYFFPGVAPAFAVIGIAAAAGVVTRDLRSSGRVLVGALAITFLFVAAVIALWPLGELVGVLWDIGRAWLKAGHGLFRAIGAMRAYWDRLSPAQSTAVLTSFVLGGTPFLIGALQTLNSVLSAAQSDRSVKDGPWQGGFMPPAEAAELARNRVGLPLGLDLKSGTILRYGPNPSRGWLGGHHALLSATRGGKSVSGIAPAICDYPGPVVAHDLKGELFATTRRHRAALGRRVVVLNPFGVVEPSHDRFNPLDTIRPGFIDRDAAVIADGLVLRETGAGAHFADMARDLIKSAIEVVMTVAEPKERTLHTVAGLLLAPTLADTLQAWADNPALAGGRPAATAAALLAAGDRERGSVITTVRKSLAWTQGDAMRPFLAASDFSLDDLLDNAIDLFVVVPLDQVSEQAGYLRLITNLVLAAAIRQDGRRVAHERILFVLDEFTRLGYMDKIVDVATIAAGAGIEALFVAQDRGSIEKVYGRDITDTLLASCATVRVFNLGRTDNRTAQWASEAAGFRTVATRTTTTRKGAGRRGSSTSVAEHRDPLLTANQVQELPADQMLVFIRGRRPLKLKRIIAHTHKAYRDKLDPNPTLRS